MSAVVVCSMRNEGAFLLEWVVWYRMLGFSDIVVVTNDCTDHSVELLSRLAEAGWVEHLDCQLPSRQVGDHGRQTARGGGPQDPAPRRKRSGLRCRRVSGCPSRRGHGRRSFVGTRARLSWSVRQLAGLRQRRADQLCRCARPPAVPRRCQAVGQSQSLGQVVLPPPRWFQRLREHGPSGLDLGKARRETGVDWGQEPLIWVNPTGRVIDRWTPEGRYLQFVAPDDLDHSVAQMNHYMLRTAETFSLKQGTPLARRGPRPLYPDLLDHCRPPRGL